MFFLFFVLSDVMISLIFMSYADVLNKIMINLFLSYGFMYLVIFVVCVNNF